MLIITLLHKGKINIVKNIQTKNRTRILGLALQCSSIWATTPIPSATSLTHICRVNVCLFRYSSQDCVLMKIFLSSAAVAALSAYVSERCRIGYRRSSSNLEHWNTNPTIRVQFTDLPFFVLLVLLLVRYVINHVFNI